MLAVFAAGAAADTGETVWLRVVNAAKGPVQVRMGSNGEWATVGRVLRPATKTAPGFGASRWAKAGTVAATAVHGLRLKAGEGEFGAMFSFVPREFASIPDLYGGHVPGDSGIRTDIPAGTAIFREWAPFTGNSVFVQLASGPIPLPADYVPVPGDVILVAGAWPEEHPVSAVFENRKGGTVSLYTRDGSSHRAGTVSQPVRGVGRFDGTSYTGVGCINTNHPGVITVSTAPVSGSKEPEGAAPERRGGFMISPSAHVRDQADGFAQTMGVAPLPGENAWEGRPPLFAGCIGLQSGVQGYRVEIQVDHGAWEPMPSIVGRDDSAFLPGRLPRYLKPAGRTVTEGVTAVRLLFPTRDVGYQRILFEKALDRQPAAVPEPTGDYKLIRGRYPVRAGRSVRSTTVSVDGQVRAAGNSESFLWNWDTRDEVNGRHWLTIRRVKESGAVSIEKRRVLVQNQ